MPTEDEKKDVIPRGPLTNSEQSLVELRKISRGVSPRPTVTVHPPDTSHALDHVAYRQAETARGVDELVRQGRSTELSAQHAAYQRDEMLDQGDKMIASLASLDENARRSALVEMATLEEQRGILDAAYESNQVLRGILDQGEISIEKLQKHSELLGFLATLQIQALEEADSQGRDIARGTSELKTQTKLGKRSAQHLENLEKLSGISIAASESVQRTLQTPARARADEAWSIGEQCRINGDNLNAKKKFEESQRDNPADPRNYLSLGLIALAEGSNDHARSLFENGLLHSRGNPAVDSALALNMAKLVFSEGAYSEAKSFLDRAFDSDRMNRNLWYEQAKFNLKMNNQNGAIYWFNNLIAVDRKINPEFVDSIMEHEGFKKVIPHLEKGDTPLDLAVEFLSSYRGPDADGNPWNPEEYVANRHARLEQDAIDATNADKIFDICTKWITELIRLTQNLPSLSLPRGMSTRMLMNWWKNFEIELPNLTSENCRNPNTYGDYMRIMSDINRQLDALEGSLFPKRRSRLFDDEVKSFDIEKKIGEKEDYIRECRALVARAKKIEASLKEEIKSHWLCKFFKNGCWGHRSKIKENEDLAKRYDEHFREVTATLRLLNDELHYALQSESEQLADVIQGIPSHLHALKASFEELRSIIVAEIAVIEREEV